MVNYILYNPLSNLFPNQCNEGRDVKLYPNPEPDKPRWYHKYLKLMNEKNLYPDMFKDEEDTEADEKAETVAAANVEED